MGTTSQIDDAIAVIRAAFEDEAPEATMKQGMQMLETMLSSLQGALGTQSAPKADPETPPKEDLPPKPAKSPAPDLLEYVIGVLKSQLDEDDRSTVDLASGEAGFSVPFIQV